MSNLPGPVQAPDYQARMQDNSQRTGMILGLSNLLESDFGIKDAKTRNEAIIKLMQVMDQGQSPTPALKDIQQSQTAVRAAENFDPEVFLFGPSTGVVK